MFTPPPNPVVDAKLADLDARVSHAQQLMLMIWRQLLNTRRTVLAAEARRLLAEAGRVARLPLEFGSQYGEDLAAWEILGKPLSGFYIEVGAFDGVNFSVTRVLEAMGWTGLLIEPGPKAFEACKRSRPGSRVVNAALAGPGSSGEVEFEVVEDEHGGMLSYSGALSADQHAKRVENAKYRYSSVRTPLTTLDTLLAGHSGPIDLVSIDVEGAEVPLLQGFDIARWKPRMLIIEDSSFGNNAAMDALIARGPYRMVGWIECNRTYLREDEAEAIRRAGEVL